MSKIKNQVFGSLKEVSICAVASVVVNIISTELGMSNSVSTALAIIVGCEIGKAFVKEKINKF